MRNNPNKLTLKHTIGPWHVCIPKHAGKWAVFYTYQGQCLGVYAANGDLVGIASIPKDNMLIHSDQNNQANANLISAAPEAIEFIADLLEVLDSQDPHKVFEMKLRGEEILKKAYNL